MTKELERLELLSRFETVWVEDRTGLELIEDSMEANRKADYVKDCLAHGEVKRARSMGWNLLLQHGIDLSAGNNGAHVGPGGVNVKVGGVGICIGFC